MSGDNESVVLVAESNYETATTTRYRFNWDQRAFMVKGLPAALSCPGAMCLVDVMVTVT
jgi:hypothetical protein